MAYKPCRVHWTDTHSYPGWHKSHELDKLYTEPAPVMQSMGWLVYEDDKHVVLAQSIGEFAMGELLKIPRSLIVEMFIENTEGIFGAGGESDVPVGD